AEAPGVSASPRAIASPQAADLPSGVDPRPGLTARIAREHRPAGGKSSIQKDGNRSPAGQRRTPSAAFHIALSISAPNLSEFLGRGVKRATQARPFEGRTTR